MKKLGKGLILRCLIESDRENLLKLVSKVFDDGNLGTGIVKLTNQLLDHYPNFSLKDNFVVVDTKNRNRIVSWLCLIRKKCIIQNLEISYGQMDMVGTDLDYRGQGLIRHLSNSLEERAAEFNLPFLVVLGIQYFYKRLGYEYAIPLEGNIRFLTERITSLKEKAEENYKIKKVNDIKNFSTYLTFREKKNLHLDLYQLIDPASLQFYNMRDLGDSDEARYFYLVYKEEKIVGNFYLVNRFGYFRIRELYVDEMAAIPSILRFAQNYASKYGLPLSVGKPVQNEIISYLECIAGTNLTELYAWYVKIPSFKKFLSQIASILEMRLQKSIYSSLTRIIRINLYIKGIELNFQDGKLVSLNKLSLHEVQRTEHPFDLSIPPNNFIQLLMGYREFNILESSNFDISCSAECKYILKILFPSMKASLIPTI